MDQPHVEQTPLQPSESSQPPERKPRSFNVARIRVIGMDDTSNASSLLGRVDRDSNWQVVRQIWPGAGISETDQVRALQAEEIIRRHLRSEVESVGEDPAVIDHCPVYMAKPGSEQDKGKEGYSIGGIAIVLLRDGRLPYALP